MTMELTFTEEEVPKITRTGGSGRGPEKWEEHLAPRKADDKVGKSARVWTYPAVENEETGFLEEKRSSAVSRMTSVRSRLTEAVPNENWKLVVRNVPDTEQKSKVRVIDNPDAPETEQTSHLEDIVVHDVGVYVTYLGTLTDEQVAENKRKHDERSKRVKASREAAEKARAETSNGKGSETSESAPSTPKERVNAARREQATSRK